MLASEVKPGFVHVPPATESVRVIVDPAQSLVGPEIADGARLTINGADVKHPVGNVYDSTTVPADTPETIPEPAPTEAIAVLPEVQTPPPVISLKSNDVWAQMLFVPEIAWGVAFTTIGRVDEHPVGTV
jgi:hypothetical protein